MERRAKCFTAQDVLLESFRLRVDHVLQTQHETRHVLLEHRVPRLSYVHHLFVIGLFVSLVIGYTLVRDQAEGEHLEIAVPGGDDLVDGRHS